MELVEQQGKGGDFLVDISAWEKVTRSGDSIINIRMEKHYKFGESAIAKPQPTPAAPKAQRSPQQLAELKLGQLKEKLATIEKYPQFEELYALLHEAERWNIFKAIPEIAKEAADLLSKKKSELILATEPIDLSSVISRIDVELSRLNMPAKEHCLIRWNKPRGQLSPDELETYLSELAIAEPNKDDDFF